jgi:hypothetical protein
MKRLVVILGITAALATPSIASAAKSPQKVKRVPAFEVIFQTTTDDRSGQQLYRLGNSGLWMQ